LKHLPPLLVALALAACGQTPAYQRPTITPPARWREDPQAVSAAPLRVDWWAAFECAELNALMTRATAQNYDLAAAIARVQEANAQARISGAALLPSLEVDGQVERTKQNIPEPKTYNDYALGAEASYEVDFWGKNRSAYNAARETAIAAAFDREVVRLTTESSVANSFFQTVSLTMRIAIAQQNLATAQKLLTGLRKEFAVGIVTSLDVTQQETLVASLTASIAPLQQQRSQSLDTLAILVGETPEQLALTTATLDVVGSPSVPPGLPSQLLERRPDVRESEAQLLAANYDIGNARAQFFPSINLTAQGGVESTALANLFTPQGLVYDLVAALAQPIFEGGKLRGQLNYAQAKYREQLADYGKAVVSAFGDVENNLAAATRSQQAIAATRQALAKARTALHMVQTQFKAGTVNVVQVLQVEQTLFNEEDAYAQTRLAQLQGMVGLAKAIGGGWSDQAAPPTPSEAPSVPVGGPAS